MQFFFSGVDIQVSCLIRIHYWTDVSHTVHVFVESKDLKFQQNILLGLLSMLPLKCQFLEI